MHVNNLTQAKPLTDSGSLTNRIFKTWGLPASVSLLLLPLLLLFALAPFFRQPKHAFVEMLSVQARWLLHGKYQ